MVRVWTRVLGAAILTLLISPFPVYGLSDVFKDQVYDPGPLKPIDSTPKLRVGDKAPDFTLPAVGGGKVSLRQYLGKKNVVISFVPAAWTPICSA